MATVFLYIHFRRLVFIFVTERDLIMSDCILNDFFARTRLDVESDDDLARVLQILSRYGSLTVKTLFFAYDFDPRESVSVHMEKIRHFKERLHIGKKAKLKTEVVSVIPLTRGISMISGIERLSLSRGNTQYLFISIPPASDPDTLVSEIRQIIYIKKFIPVITGIEKAALSLSDGAASSLYKIPGAIYQIDLCSLSSKNTRELVKNLITAGKTVIFGSGDGFDLCPYANFDYYTKLLSRAIGTKSLGYFTILHNRVFR